jgi:hypothetical protein
MIFGAVGCEPSGFSVHPKFSASQWGVLAATAALLIVFWMTRITDTPIVWDAAENLRLTLNLERNGVVSMSATAPIVPSMYREPVPVFFGKFAVRAVDRVLGRADTAEYYRGERAKLLKYQNIPWLALLSAVVFIIGQELGLAFLPSLLCVLLTNLLLLNADIGYFMLDNLYTEAAATALLSLGSLLLLTGVGRKGLTRIALAGACFGVLALVKALFLYITLGLVIAIPSLSLLLRRSMGAAVLRAAVLGALAALVVLPWMLRNYLDMGQFGISQRGGEVLYDRAIMDQMTRDEYVGSFYLSAPYPLNGALRRLFGYSNKDIEEGGRLQRLNQSSDSSFFVRDYSAENAGRPQDAITYVHRAGADRVLLSNQLAAAGNPQPEIASDREVQARARAIILHHPFRHLALIPMYLWQGAFFSFPALAVIVFYAFSHRKYELAVMVLPAFASLLFYASFAHLEPRYGIPTYPIIICVLVALACRYSRPFNANSVLASG